MNTELIIRAWKDPEFRASLTPEERSALPECPAGTAFIELEEGELKAAVGGDYGYGGYETFQYTCNQCSFRCGTGHPNLQ